MSTLGPFALRAPLDRGGMGVVWRAVHEASDVPVAIKLIPMPERGAGMRVRDEVRATAALDHPGIVALLDHGEVDTDTLDVPRGSLWLAMELVSGGSLVPWLDDLSWEATRRVLLALLDALAHAHARGVVHRDLKPGNVLVAGADDRRPGLRLTDFGIAAVLDAQGAIGQPAGTLHYMAPEQILGHWREYGPWTDLYALGVLAWRITTGRTPFFDRRGAALLQAHLTEALPPLRPRLAVPDGLEGWIRRLLARGIGDRYSRAADAALDLARLPSFAAEPSGGELLVGWGRAAAAWWTDRAAEATRTTRWVPAGWERPVDAGVWPALGGVGLGVWGLRRPPLVGRREEQDTLWAEVRAAGARSLARTVVLVGPEGVGKSRLAAWVAERAEEVGVATCARTRGRPDDPPGASLRRLVEQILGTRGLERSQVRDRIGEWLAGHGGDDRDTTASLAGIVREGGAGGPVRYAAVVDLVRRHAAGRLAILVLDDLDADPDLLGLATWIAGREEAWPLLVVATAPLEVRAGREAEREALVALLAGPAVREIRVGPLALGEQHHLVRSLLGLDGELSADLAERTRGNPGFAVELAGRWVARGALVAGQAGLALETESDAALPADLRQAWVARAHRALRGLGPAAGEALEAAAILGAEPEGWVWAQLAPDPALRAAVVRRLAEAGLVEVDGDAWSFRHAALPEALAADLPPRRATLLHRAAARALAERADEPASAERFGRHLLAAGEPDAAVATLLLAARGRMRAVGPRPALLLVRAAQRALDAAGAPASDPRRGDVAVTEAHLHLLLGDVDRALAVSGAARTTARALGWPCRHLAALELGRALLASGALRRAAELAAEVAADPETSSSDRATARWLCGVVAARLDPATAEEHFRWAAAEYARLGEDGGRGDCLRRLALLPGQTDPEAGVAEALAIAERLGRNVQIARCLEARAELALRAGDGARAEAAARRAVRVWTSTWPEAGGEAHLLLGRILLARGRSAEASGEAEAALLAPGTAETAASAGALALAAAAESGDWPAWDRRFRRVAAWFDEAELPPDAVLSGLLVAAGDAAARAGMADRARPPWVLARECSQGAARRALDERLAGLRDGG